MAFEENYLLTDDDFSPVSIQSLYERPLNIKQFKDFKTFKNIIDCALRKLPPLFIYVSDDLKNLNEVCLDIASKNGLTKFVKILLREGAKVNRVNNTYNRAPIHFATEGGHVDTLEALLAEPTVNPNLSGGQQTALDIAVNNNNEKCVSLLLQKGASANIPNSEDNTAIHVAALNSKHDIVQLIMQNHWQCLDLDNIRKYDQQTTREVIQQNLPELLISKESCREHFFPCHMYDLKYYLNINDETNFLKNMLNDEDTFSSMVEELLKIATQNDLHKAVKGILDWLEGTEEEDTKKFVVEQAARVAIKNDRHAILLKLLNVVPDIANNLILDVCLELKKLRNETIDARSVLEKPDISNWLKCMELMLDHEGVDIHKLMDDKSNTLLHYAAKSGCREAVTLILNRGSYIGHMNKFNIPPIAYIPENTLSSYFDDCIQMDEQTNAIKFNYRCLMPYNISRMNDLGSRELEVFMYIAHNSKLKNLLKHPLLSSFLYLKRHMIRNILCIHFFVYVSFYLLLNLYIYSMACNSSPNENGTQLVNDIPLGSSFVQNIYQNNIWRNTIIIFLLIFIFREILQFVCCFWYYIKDFKNCLQIMLIVLTITLLCGGGLQIGITVILLSTWEFMILISRWPMFSISIMIFRTVFYNFVRLFSPYVFLIVPFALVFHISFKDSDDPNFSNPVFSIFKTIIMLTGEFNIDDISFASHTVWNRIVFVMFVFLVVIVLNGLAVSNAEILSKTELIGLICQIELITYFENIVYAIGEPIRRWPSKIPLWWKSFGSLVSSEIFLFLQHLKDGTIRFKMYDSLDSHDDNATHTAQKLQQYCSNIAATLQYCRNVAAMLLQFQCCMEIYSKSEKNNEYCTIFKMDDNIIEQAKQIILNKNQLSDNDRIMIALNKLQKALGITSDETEVLD